MRRTTQHEQISTPQLGPPVPGSWRLDAGDEPPLAAHLVTPRRLYAHHGLFVGCGRVIHYRGFVNGLAPPPRFEGAEVIKRARSRLGEDRYRLLTNNCEHFCEWCIRGESRSAQVDFYRRRWHGILARRQLLNRSAA